MRLSVLSLGVLPVFISLAGGVPSHYRSVEVKSLQIDSQNVQASFAVSCSECLGANQASPTSPPFASDLDLHFTFSVTPSVEPCNSNLTLNSVPLSPSWDENFVFSTERTSVPASGHEVTVVVASDCIAHNQQSDYPKGPATQVLTLVIDSVDGKSVPLDSGFTISFKDDAPPEIVRISDKPTDLDANREEDLKNWIDPPAEHRVALSDLEDITAETSIAEETTTTETIPIEEHIEDLKFLEAHLDTLQSIVAEKKKWIETQLQSDSKGLKEEIQKCDGFFCIAKAIFRKVHGAANVIYLKLRPNSYGDILMNQSRVWRAGNQHPTSLAMSADTLSSLPASPEKCHCRDSKPSVKRPSGEDGSHEALPDDSKFREALPPSRVQVILKFLLFITGISFILRLFHRCYVSPRRRRDQLARREERRTARAYRRSARRQAFWDWWRGTRRGNPGRRPGDYDEKRSLVGQQEGVLEGAMQDEIQHLKIEEEIRQLSRTRDVVDELVRAEEGRLHPPHDMLGASSSSSPPSSSLSSSSSSSSSSSYPGAPKRGKAPPPPPIYPAGFAPLTFSHPMSIPGRPTSPLSSVSSTSDGMPFSPVSRTTSLPSYRSKPPSYRENDSETDGFSDCSLGMETSGSGSDADGDGWATESIHDLSPRPSAETTRTFL